MRMTKILWVAVPVAFALAVVLTMLGPAPEAKPEVKLRQMASVADGDNPEDVERARSKIEDSLERLGKGESFTELADELYEAPDAGEVIWRELGLLPSNLEEIVFSLEKGRYSDVIEEKLDDGRIVFRILYIEDRRNF